MYQKRKRLKAVILWLEARTTKELFGTMQDKIAAATDIDTKLDLAKSYQRQIQEKVRCSS